MKSKSIAGNYRFLLILISAMVLGSITGYAAPDFAHGIKFLGDLFIRMMFCVVVPMVFASIAGAVANMKSRKRAGKIMGVTVLSFVITGAFAAIVFFLLCQIFPPVLQPWKNLSAEEVGEHASLTEMVLNFFTVEDFVGLLSRRAMLPLIVFSVLFGFSVNLAGEAGKKVAEFLESLTAVMMKFVQIVTYYAPIAFFAIFADLVASYGPQITESYARALVLYYPVCFIYIFTAFPLMAYIGAGMDGPYFKACYRGFGNLFFRGYHSHQYGGGGGKRNFQGCFRYCASFGSDHAHGRFLLLLCTKDLLCNGSLGNSGELCPASGNCVGCGILLCGNERCARGRIYRRVYYRQHFLPQSNGGGLPYSGSHRQSGGSTGNYD